MPTTATASTEQFEASGVERGARIDALIRDEVAVGVTITKDEGRQCKHGALDENTSSGGADKNASEGQQSAAFVDARMAAAYALLPATVNHAVHLLPATPVQITSSHTKLPCVEGTLQRHAFVKATQHANGKCTNIKRNTASSNPASSTSTPVPQNTPWNELVLQAKEQGGGLAVCVEPGIVHLRRFLSVDVQQAIVEECVKLQHKCNTEPDLGGMVWPLFTTGQPYHLRMMCCGVHWNCRTHEYMQRRTNIDGKRVPPIPDLLQRLVQKSLRAAQRLDSRLPHMRPNSLLVNFFEPNGKLGLHRDDDEEDDTLRAGLSVVSFTIGDAMEFFWEDEETDVSGQAVLTDQKGVREIEETGQPHPHLRQRKVLLQSGDVLIFGGPARLIRHASRYPPMSCPAVDPNTISPPSHTTASIQPDATPTAPMQTATRSKPTNTTPSSTKPSTRQRCSRPAELRMVPGRLNLTFRQTTFADSVSLTGT